MKPYMDAVKLKVDEEDIVMDFFCATIPVRVQMRGEPAVDTGGVLRQAFTDVFGKIISGESYLHLFRGANQRLTAVNMC